jgi:hypothetical protein
MEIPNNKLFENLIGKQFGRLTVKEYASPKYPTAKTKGHQWLCKCQCGNEKIILGGSLKKGQTTSCGCQQKEIMRSRLIDLTGNTYGKLIVIKLDWIKSGQPYWTCKCECGNEKSVAGVSLRENKTNSCGCAQKFGNFIHGLWGTPEYRKLRMSNPVIRLQHNVSTSVRDAIRERDGRKSGKTFDHLPYTVEELKFHIESLWESWMNWDNYGGANNSKNKSWQIDHIIPHSKFPYKSFDDILFQECWALSNLRPLEKIENIRKNNR